MNTETINELQIRKFVKETTNLIETLSEFAEPSYWPLSQEDQIKFVRLVMNRCAKIRQSDEFKEALRYNVMSDLKGTVTNQKLYKSELSASNIFNKFKKSTVNEIHRA
ncbi:MAG: hypothetical protein ACOCUT_04390 [bacterium]